MKAEEPTIEHTTGPGDDNQTIERHPAFALIGASRVTTGGGGYYLYGSDFSHRAFMTISIRRSELTPRTVA